MKLVVIALMVVIAMAAPQEDLVKEIPGMGKFDKYKFYSGYIDATPEHHLHYMFIESQDTPAEDPVVIWYNGGPGCSSVLGMAQEHGPFVMDDGADEFRENEWSWNKHANMLYIEAPAGVGFSYTDYEKPKYNDDSSAVDNYFALLDWYEKFPEYKDNELFISGESYAGIYVPYLAHEIVTRENDLNLQGVIVGNGVTNWTLDTNNAFQAMGFWHNVVYLDHEEKLEKYNCLPQGEGIKDPDGPADSLQCTKLLIDFQRKVSKLNMYDIYRECYYPPENERLGLTTINGEEKTYRRGFTAMEYTPWLFGDLTEEELGVEPPCVYAAGPTDYFNREDVREALHIKTDQVWEICTNRIKYSRGITKGSMWTYPILRDAGLRILHYTGNTDGAVPAEGTRAWINYLDWEITSPYQPYFVRDRQVGGFVEERGLLTYATVQGVGHMAPQWSPEASFHFYQSFLDNKPIANP